MIRLLPYDAAWPAAFEAEAAALRESFGPLAKRIDHVGSTSVPGLEAKPVIDIQVSVASLETLEPFTPIMQACGYVHFRDPDPAFERAYPYFHKPHDWPHSHHVHLCESGSEWEWRHLAFRDYLRTHPEAREEYVALKRRLAAIHGGANHDERQAYADAKSELVRRILDAARRGRS